MISRRALVASLASQVSVLVYLEVTEWIDLFPWNDIRQGNGQAGLDLVLGLLIVLAIVATRRQLRAGVVAATLLYAVWFTLQLDTWWLNYLRGASPEWERVYAQHFSQTTQFLPRVGTHLPPDANHVVLQALLTIALVSTARVAIGLTRRSTRTRLRRAG